MSGVNPAAPLRASARQPAVALLSGSWGPSHKQAGSGGDGSIPAWSRRQAGSGRAFCSLHSWRLLDVPAPGGNLITLMQLWRRGGYLPGSFSSFVRLVLTLTNSKLMEDML